MQFQNIIKFSEIINKLKQVKRAGWCRYQQIENVESVADHSWRVAMLCLFFKDDQQIKLDKCMEYAILHDLAECVIGDITPQDNVKFNAMQSIVDSLDLKTRNMLITIWQEYEDKNNQESKLVKDLDRYEMINQAFIYEKQYQVNLQEFYKNINEIHNPTVKQWAQQIIDLRKTTLFL